MSTNFETELHTMTEHEQGDYLRDQGWRHVCADGCWLSPNLWDFRRYSLAGAIQKIIDSDDKLRVEIARQLEAAMNRPAQQRADAMAPDP